MAPKPKRELTTPQKFSQAAQKVSRPKKVAALNAGTVTDPLYDPRIEAITTELHEIIPKVTLTVNEACHAAGLCVGHRFNPHEYDYSRINYGFDEAKQFYTKMDAQQKLKWHGANERGGWLTIHSHEIFNKVMLSVMQTNKEYVFPRKSLSPIIGEVNDAWRSFLESTDPIQAAHNARIEQLFNDWYGLIDFGPERELRKSFLAKLRNDNHLGQILTQWEYLRDIDPAQQPSKKKDALLEERFDHETWDGLPSRGGVLQKINRIFEQTYCKPLGLASNTRIIFSRTKRRKISTPGYYEPATQNIILRVPDEFGTQAPGETSVSRPGLANDWKYNAPLIILIFLEERLHKFAHQVCLAYADGSLKQRRKWESFARGMAPQFQTTEARFYAEGTYYTLNPAEEHAEAFRRDVFKVIYKTYVQAYEAMALDRCARNHRPESSMSGAMERALKRSAALAR